MVFTTCARTRIAPRRLSTRTKSPSTMPSESARRGWISQRGCEYWSTSAPMRRVCVPDRYCDTTRPVGRAADPPVMDDTSFDVGRRALVSFHQRTGQHDVGVPRGLGQEEVDHREELQAAERLADEVAVRQ